ncbi:MAG: flagellar basal body L-ring protein FlgH, partial [Deltaproteobacteria bacterium]|nr:flagellar basal body L-ring protein FlgH [Deltaproteobacteria bacterium]
MKTNSRKLLLLALMALAAVVTGCESVPAPKAAPVQEAVPRRQYSSEDRVRSRPPINPSQNLYEGSLWRGASSWGNLLRDHRARYRGDLLTITELSKIIKVPEVKPEEIRPEAVAEQKTEIPDEDPVLKFLREQEKRRENIDREQNEILGAIDMIEVEVVRVMPNGNLQVRGVHPPIFRDRNRIKYIVSVGGMVRPSDVDDNNNIPATKLHKAEYKIQRLVRGKGTQE